MSRNQDRASHVVRQLPLADDARVLAASDPRRKDELLQDILTMPHTTIPSRRFSRRATIGAATFGAATVAAVGLANGLFLTDTSTGCHLPDGNLVVIDAVDGDPIAACASVWATDGGSAPHLTAYDNGLGGIAVVEAGSEVPDGWTPLPAGTVNDPRVVELASSVADHVDGLNAECFTTADADAFVTEEYARLGLAGWTVADETAADGTQICATARVDAESTTVTLGARPPIPSMPWQEVAVDIRERVTGCMTADAAAEQVRGAVTGLDGVTVTVLEAEGCARVDMVIGGAVDVVVRGS